MGSGGQSQLPDRARGRLIRGWLGGPQCGLHACHSTAAGISHVLFFFLNSNASSSSWQQGLLQLPTPSDLKLRGKETFPIFAMQPHQLQGRTVSGNLHYCFPQVVLLGLDLNKAQGSGNSSTNGNTKSPPSFTFAVTCSAVVLANCPKLISLQVQVPFAWGLFRAVRDAPA